MDLSFLGGEPFDDGDQAGSHSGLDPAATHDPAHHDPAYQYDTSAHHGTSSLDEHLWMHDDGRLWDLGPADVDSEGDGIKDTLTRNGPDGLTVYTDTNHDGQVDKITSIRPDGDFTTRTLDTATGAWLPTDSGRIG